MLKKILPTLNSEVSNKWTCPFSIFKKKFLLLGWIFDPIRLFKPPRLFKFFTLLLLGLSKSREFVVKIIIEKSRGEVSPMGQDTIENVS